MFPGVFPVLVAELPGWFAAGRGLLAAGGLAAGLGWVLGGLLPGLHASVRVSAWWAAGGRADRRGRAVL
jgi:hypothetical protein